LSEQQKATTLVSLKVYLETIKDKKKQFGGGCHGTLDPTTHGYHKADHNDSNYFFFIITLVYVRPAAVQAPHSSDFIHN